MGKKTAFEWDDDDLDRLAELIADKIAARESKDVDFSAPGWRYYQPYWIDPRHVPYYPGPYWWQSPVTCTTTTVGGEVYVSYNGSPWTGKMNGNTA